MTEKTKRITVPDDDLQAFMSCMGANELQKDIEVLAKREVMIFIKDNYCTVDLTCNKLELMTAYDFQIAEEMKKLIMQYALEPRNYNPINEAIYKARAQASKEILDAIEMGRLVRDLNRYFKSELDTER